MSDPSDNEDTKIADTTHHKRVISGVGWNFVAIIGEQLSSLVAFVIIARILGPKDFGIVILSVALVDILISFVRAGISEALIRIKDLTPEILGTAFWLNMGISLFIACGLLIAAPFFGAAMHVPQVVPLLEAMTIVFPVAAAGAIAEALLARNMAFAAIARRQVIGSLAGALTAIGLATSGFGVWAMIAQRIVIFIVGASLSIWAAKLIPPRRFSLGTAKEILHYSGGITSINLLYRLQPRIAELVIGFIAQPAAVALYRAAYRVVDLVNQLPMQPLMRVVFPTLSRLTDNPEKFKKTLFQFIQSLALILLPIYAGIGYFSHDIFHLLFGSKWDAAVPAFILLLVAAGIRIPFSLLGPAASARGAVRFAAIFSFLDVAISVLLMFATASFGINAIAGSRILGAVLLLPCAYFLLLKPSGFRFVEMAKAISSPAAVMFVLLGVLFATGFFLGKFTLNFGLASGLPLCVATYFALILLFVPKQVRSLLELIDNGASRKFLRIAYKYKVIKQ